MELVDGDGGGGDGGDSLELSVVEAATGLVLAHFIQRYMIIALDKKTEHSLI